MQRRMYSFHSVWHIAAPRDMIWRELSATPFSWPSWWPALHDVHSVNITPELTGSSFSCIWQSIGYRLHCRVSVTASQYPGSVTLQSTGDLEGTAHCTVAEDAGNTTITINMKASTTKPWMNYVAPLLEPLFRRNHHAIMRSGERGLQAYMETKKAQH